MMRFIIGSSLKLRFIVIALAALMMLLGLAQLKSTPVDVFPEFAPPKVEIQTACLGLTAEEVEGLVTVPLEESMSGMDNLDVIRSKSVSQLSSIELIFEPGTDLLQARQLVAERMAAVIPTLPTWAAPPVMIQPLSSTSRVMKIGLSSDKVNTMELSMISYWKIRARLLQVPGVANVAIWGERLQMYQVQADPKRMQTHGVSIDEIMNATADSLDAGLLMYSDGAIIGTGGIVENLNQRLGVRNVLPIISTNDLAQVTLTRPNAPTVQLKDVAVVKEDHQQLIGDAVINGGPGIMLIVEKLPWGNTLDVTKGVEAALEEMKPGLPDIAIDSTIFRPATFIENAIHNLSTTLLIGCGLVILVLIFFLLEWRAALISLTSIPLSLIAAALVLDARGATVNTMVLAGLVIAVGVVVDDAIIDIENIVRRLRLKKASQSLRSVASTVLESSLEVRRPIVYATLINVVAVIPVYFLEGLTGSFFRPLVLSYSLAVLASMVVALTVTPALALILFRGAPLDRRDPKLVRWLQDGYGKLLHHNIARPRPAYIVIAGLVIISVIVLPRLGQSLLPDFKERDFLMHWVTKPGTSHPETVRITTESSKELRSIPGVRNFGAHIGQAFAADEVVGINFSENWISIDPKADYDKTLKAVQDVVEGYPGLYRDVQTYLKERIREVLTGGGEAIIVRIYGKDLNVLRENAEKVKNIMSETPGIIEEHVELQENIPQIDVQVDIAKAQAHGIKPGDVRRAAATMVAGEEVGDIFRDGKAYDVQVWSTPETRANLTNIIELPLHTPNSGFIRLGDVASVNVKPTPNIIHREDVSRSIDVGANVRGRDIGSVVKDIEYRLSGMQFPLEYRAELLGEYEEREDANEKLMIYAGVAAVAIFMLLQMAFGSFKLATIFFLTLPMALVGGIMAATFGGGVISLGSLVGFFTVLGIAARNGILLINHFQHLENEEGVPFGRELVIRGAQERLRPILMTALATAFALVPLVIAGNIAGHEIEYPMAVVILGGLITSTLINLFVVPILYLRFAKKRIKLPV